MTDKGSIFLEDGVIFLRPLAVEDVTDEYIEGLNDPEVNRYLVNVRNNVQTRVAVEDFILANADNPSSTLFGIFIKDDPDPFIGTLRISGIDFSNYLASIGICLFAKRAWEKGYAVQSINMVKEYLFDVVGLNYLEAGVYSANSSSLNLFITAGFTESHRFKDKYRHIDSFEEVTILKATNPAFDHTLLK